LIEFFGVEDNDHDGTMMTESIIIDRSSIVAMRDEGIEVKM